MLGREEHLLSLLFFLTIISILEDCYPDSIKIQYLIFTFGHFPPFGPTDNPSHPAWGIACPVNMELLSRNWYMQRNNNNTRRTIYSQELPISLTTRGNQENLNILRLLRGPHLLVGDWS